jgi:hypothetical protein
LAPRTRQPMRAATTPRPCCSRCWTSQGRADSTPRHGDALA